MKFRTIAANGILTLTLAAGTIGGHGSASGSTALQDAGRLQAPNLREGLSTAGATANDAISTTPSLPQPARSNRGARSVAMRSGHVDGASLYYTSNCASCHGKMANMRGATAEMIQSAIDNNVGGMGFHVTLSPEEINSIADALK
ncbi:cytochrome c [Geobacter sp.]|uniref:c-type cytochrome n=1 Tax=Geobacter sp. TaxID=46610 RepID=UPI0026307ACE|nr:cytochrome c [Geobacter sp.]